MGKRTWGFGLVLAASAVLLVGLPAPRAVAGGPSRFRVVYTSNGDLWLRDFPGASRLLTWGDATDRAPTLSPDGRRVAFLRNGDLMVMSTDGGEPRPLAEGGTATLEAPTWSPRGDVVVYTRYTAVTGCVEMRCAVLWGVAANSSNLEGWPITSGADGSFTPDGKHLVFVDLRHGLCAPTFPTGCDGHLFSVDIDGTHRRDLGLVGDGPQVSADGRRLLFQRGEGKDADVWVADSDGSRSHPLVHRLLNDEYEPKWIGTSSNFLYSCYGPSGPNCQGIYAVDADGRQPTLVAAGGYEPDVRAIL